MFGSDKRARRADTSRMKFIALTFIAAQLALAAPTFTVVEDDEKITISGAALDAAIRKKGYVSGVAAGSLHDKKTGARDLGFGLDIADWIMEAGSDEAYRAQLSADLPYPFGNLFHGKRPKRSIEGPQICTKARALLPHVVQGTDFVAVTMDFQYKVAAPGKATGSRWDQTLVFPAGKRYFVSSDRITSRNASDEMFLRVDMPGHLKHKAGDTFSEVYLSYHGRIPASEFLADFPPDAKFNYRRDSNQMPQRFIRAYHIKDGPWLAGMTLNPSDVYEAWCHQRGYICFIEEFGGRPVKPGESFSAAFIVGYFDSIEEMERVYDEHAGHSGLAVSATGWKLTK